MMIVQKFVLGVTVCPGKAEVKQLWKALELKRPSSTVLDNDSMKCLLIWMHKV